MSESKIKLLILTWPDGAPRGCCRSWKQGWEGAAGGGILGPSRTPQGRCLCHSQCGVADRPDGSGSSCHNITDGFSSLCIRRVGTCVLLCPSFIQNPQTQVFCHEMRGSFMCVHTGCRSCSVQSHSEGTASPSSPNCELSHPWLSAAACKALRCCLY